MFAKRVGQTVRMSSDIQKLAQAIRQRRLDLGKTQEEIANEGGPSDTTLGKLENAQVPDPSRGTLVKVDVGLRWHEGSARRVLRGGVPVPLGQNIVDLSDDERDSLRILARERGDIIQVRNQRMLDDLENEPIEVREVRLLRVGLSATLKWGQRAADFGASPQMHHNFVNAAMGLMEEVSTLIGEGRATVHQLPQTGTGAPDPLTQAASKSRGPRRQSEDDDE